MIMKIGFYFILLLMTALSLSCSGNKEKKNATDAADKVEAQSASALANQDAEDRGYIVKVGDTAPDFTIRTTGGEVIKLSDLRGKIVMLQFTASWCVVCREEMPFIESDIWQKHNNNPKFRLFGIDRDEPLEKVKEFAQQTGITYPLALDPGGDFFALYAERNAGITRNVIIGVDGRIAMLTRLYNSEEFSEMCRKIDELLGSISN